MMASKKEVELRVDNDDGEQWLRKKEKEKKWWWWFVA
jgi:hypothetical protein